MAAVIIADTRQKPGHHDRKHSDLEGLGYRLESSKLFVGDYARPAAVAVDTKQHIQELAQDVYQQHERFKRECVRAKDAGTRLVILTENAHGITCLATLGAWVEPMCEFKKRRGAKRRIYGSTLAKACATMRAKYGVEFEFCSPGQCGARIVEILNEYERGGQCERLRSEGRCPALRGDGTGRPPAAAEG